MLKTFPDILMATVAWLLLLGVAAFSIRAARRRIAYETWYYAHLYTYLAIALAFSHQFADGGTFAESYQARVAWSALVRGGGRAAAVVPGHHPAAQRRQAPLHRAVGAARGARHRVGADLRP